MKKFNQVLSVAISAAIAVTAAPWQAYAAPGSGPAFVQTFTPPTRLGYVESSYQGTNAKPVILIQDLHANLGVQKKIIGLLKFLQPKVSSSDKMVIGMENAWKDYDLSYVRSKALPIRTKAMNILLKEALINGPEYFATLATNNIQLIGVDDKEDKRLNLELTRQSFQLRLGLSSKVDQIRHKIQVLKTVAPHSLKTLWHAEADYQNGKIGLDVLAHEMGRDTVLTNDKQAQEVLMNRKLELAEKDGGKDSQMLQSVVVADQTFNMLSRLLRQQMTLEEVQFVAQHAEQFLSVVRTFLPNENLAEWKDAMNTAVDYYSIALVRNTPLAENTAQLVAQNPDTSMVVVTGGFHTAGIAKILEQKNISYIVLSPVVESHTARDEMLYIRRILGEPLETNELAADLKNASDQSFDLQPGELTQGVPGQQSGTIGQVLDSVQVGQVVPVVEQPETDTPEKNPDGTPTQRKAQPVFTPVRDIRNYNPAVLLVNTIDIVSNVSAGQSYVVNGSQIEKLRSARQVFDQTSRDMLIQPDGVYFLSPSVVNPGQITILKEGEILHSIHVSANTDSSLSIVDSIGLYPNFFSGNPTSKKVVDAIDKTITAMGHDSLQDFLAKYGVTDLDIEFAPNNIIEETFFENLGNGRVRVRLSPSLITNKDPNAIFVAVAKALVNIETPDKDEDVTLPRFFEVAAAAIGWDALTKAYQAFSLGGAPFVAQLKDIAAKLSLSGLTNAEQAEAVRRDIADGSHSVINRAAYALIQATARVLYRNVNGVDVMRKAMPVAVTLEDGSTESWSSVWRGRLGGLGTRIADWHESIVGQISAKLNALIASGGDAAEIARTRKQLDAAKAGLLSAA